MTYAKDAYSEITPMIALTRSVTVDGGLIAKSLAIGNDRYRLVVKEGGVYIGCPCMFNDEGAPLEKEELRYYSLHSVIEAIQELNRRTAWMENDMGVSESFALTDQLGTGNVNTYYSTTKDLLPGLRNLEEETRGLKSGTINEPFIDGLPWTQEVDNVPIWKYTFTITEIEGKEMVTFSVQRGIDYVYDEDYGDYIEIPTVTDTSYITPYGKITDSNGTDAIITDTSYMFSGCTLLTELDLSGWNTANVTTMESMFMDCDKLQTLDLSGWKTDSLTNMCDMFDNCILLQDINGISNWDTADVTDTSSMFSGCTLLTELDLSGWNTANVTTMERMFFGCDSLATVMVSQTGANMLEKLPTGTWTFKHNGTDRPLQDAMASDDWTEFTNDGSTTLTFTRTISN